VEREVEHLPVLADEVTFLLRPRRGGWVVDGTIGMGGHAERLLDAGGEGTRVTLRHGSFREIGGHAREAGIGPAATVLLDLGLSSHQLDASGRGFTFQKEEPLDMRFDPTRGRTAAELLAELPEAEMARVLFEYGGERHARRIARRIVERRRQSPLTVTGDLVDAVKRGVPRAAWSLRTHVATRTFQALRMAVNEESQARPGGGAGPPGSRRAARHHLVSLGRGPGRQARLPGAPGGRLRRARALAGRTFA
jgi:16S rRNA (cytosine1402-N4)-methyltransferase